MTDWTLRWLGRTRMAARRPLAAPVLPVLVACMATASFPSPGKANAIPVPAENPKRDIAVIRQAELPTPKGLLITPEAGSAAEARHNEMMDAAIAPLRNLKLELSDVGPLRAAFRAIDGNKPDEVPEHRAALQHPVARKLVDWALLRRGIGSIAEYTAFLDANPMWPNRWRLFEHLEAKLFLEASPEAIERYFASRKPESTMGRFALAAAHLATGRKAEAQALASAAWRNDDIPAKYEDAIASRLAEVLTPADHKWRADRLLTDDFRWSASRNERAAVVRRQLPRLSDAERRIAEARLAVLLRDKSAAAKLAALPAESATDWGVVYHRVVLLRRGDKNAEAKKILLSAPLSRAELVNPDAWWDERRIQAYEALDAGNPKLAYALVREPGDLTVNPLKEQAFTAGWLALRYLGDVKAAVRHFKVMDEAADGPLSRAKSAYWLGRALEASGEKSAARASYERAAAQFDTFHGQLALQRLSPGNQTLPIGPPQAPTDAQIAAFRSNDAAEAAVIAEKAGLGRNITRPFLANLASVLPTEAETALAAHLTRALGDTQQSLRIGKRAVAEGMNLIYYSYPLHAMPAYKPLREPPEPAFLLGIARQESEFNTEIVSGAGARGILQVMPITAKHVCRDYKIKCDIPRLSTDEAYNTMISSAYIGDRMGEFGGSYVLGLAGYNAGPGRARQWIRRFGDPRDGKIDPIDWIERIPFSETRGYVGKVLSNIQVYRARLGEANPLRLEQDLARAQAGNAAGRRALTAPGGKPLRIGSGD